MKINWAKTYAANVKNGKLIRVCELSKTRLKSLTFMDAQKAALLKNTAAFVAKKPANHALLWGEMGCGKSSLVRAVFIKYRKKGLRLIEIAARELPNLYKIIKIIRQNKKYNFIIFCDDFSFEAGDIAVGELKNLLEGNIEAPPANALFYATSNTKHLVRATQNNSDNYLIQRENDRQNLSLADRFGLQISFYELDFPIFLKAAQSYFWAYLKHYPNSDFARKYSGEFISSEAFAAQLMAFASSKGGVRSHRAAEQFFKSCQSQI